VPDSAGLDEVLWFRLSQEPFPLDSGVSNVVLQVNGGRDHAIGAEVCSAALTLPPGTNVIRPVPSITRETSARPTVSSSGT
jgi:hypothetical protein